MGTSKRISRSITQQHWITSLLKHLDPRRMRPQRQGQLHERRLRRRQEPRGKRYTLVVELSVEWDLVKLLGILDLFKFIFGKMGQA